MESEFRSGQVFAERYKILQLLLSGPVNVIYRVEDLTTGRIVALKLIRASLFQRKPEVLTQYRLDLNSLRQVAHTGVVRIFDFGEYSGRLYLAMEMVNGSTLADYLQD